MHRLGIAVAVLPACAGSDDAAPAAGFETGPCIEGQCVGEAQCLSDVCVLPDVPPEDPMPPPPSPADDDTGADPPDADPDPDGADDTSGASTGPAGDTTAGVDDGSSTTAGPRPGDDGASSTGEPPAPDPDDGRDDADLDDGGVGFVDMPDVGPGTFQCDLFSQDCPVGEKCNPWANDGGGTWNATHCVPIDPSPAAIGQPCQVEGSGVSGIDTCDLGAMCWNVDADGDGTCIEICSGSIGDPQCTTPATTCAVANGGAIAVCMPTCDPLIGDCPPGQGCYPVGEALTCAPDASGPGGLEGDACAHINGCDPGLVCVAASGLADCVGAAACCTSWCEVGVDACAVAGETCVAWFTEGQAPPGAESLGACLIPA